MKQSELCRKLKKLGCFPLGTGTNHDWWYNPVNGKKFQVPRHRTAEINEKLLGSIKKQSGLNL